jgi:hypothetical protein
MTPYFEVYLRQGGPGHYKSWTVKGATGVYVKQFRCGRAALQVLFLWN